MSISYIIIDKPTDNDVTVIVQKSFFSKGRGRGTINYEKNWIELYLIYGYVYLWVVDVVGTSSFNA